MEGSLNIKLNVPLRDMSFLDKVAKSRGWLITAEKSRSDNDSKVEMEKKLERVDKLFGIFSKRKVDDWKSEKEDFLRKKYL